MRGWIVALLFLAGCAGPAPAVRDAGPDVITDPKDFDKSAQGAHIHDYWGGATRLTLLDMEDGCASCRVTYGGDHGVILGSFRPDPDHVVPMGTAWVHATATWSVESGDFKDVALYVQTANQTDMEFVGVLEQGTTFTFNSTNDDNDPPHHRLSLWKFEVRGRSATGDGASATNFETTLRVEVERGLEIPVFPAHPDHWNGTTQILLHTSERDVEQLETPTYFQCRGCLGWHTPDDGRIVPPTASDVEVVLETDSMLPATIGLMFHGADTWDHVRAEPIEATENRVVWLLPVEGRPDSPYAKQSLWSMYLVNDQPTPAKYWEGAYTITVTAVR